MDCVLLSCRSNILSEAPKATILSFEDFVRAVGTVWEANGDVDKVPRLTADGGKRLRSIVDELEG